MDNVPFTVQDIEGLADRLSRINPPLSGQERLLLVAIFAAAAARAKPTEPFGKATLPSFAVGGEPDSEYGVTSVPLDDLKHQLLNAFIPGQDFTWVTAGRTMEKVVGQPWYPPRPPPPPPPDGE